MGKYDRAQTRTNLLIYGQYKKWNMNFELNYNEP